MKINLYPCSSKKPYITFKLNFLIQNFSPFFEWSDHLWSSICIYIWHHLWMLYSLMQTLYFFYILYTTLLHIDYNRPQIHSHTNVLVLSSPCLSIMILATMKLNDNGLAHSWNISLPYFRTFESHSKKTLNGQPFLHSLLQIQWSMIPEFKGFFWKKILFYIFKKSGNGLLIKISHK